MNQAPETIQNQNQVAEPETQLQAGGEKQQANQEQVTPDLQPETPVSTEISDDQVALYNQQITEALRDGDSKKINDIREELEKISGNQKEVEIPEDPQKADQQDQNEKPLQQQQQQQQLSDESKPFVVYHKGQRIEREDQNRLFGFKDTGSLKAAYVKRELELEETRKLLNEALANAQKAPQQPQQPQPQQPNRQTAHQQAIQAAQQAQQQQSAPRRPALPIPPAVPEYSTDDPLDYTDEDRKKAGEYRNAMKDYSKAVRDYNVQNEAYLNYIEKRPGTLPDEVQEKLKQFDDLQSQLQEINRGRQEIENQKVENAHWQRFTDFQNSNESFKTPMHIKDMDVKAKDWSNSVAAANGVQMPQTEENPNDPAWQAYYMHRADIVDKYLNDDSQVKANSAGYEPPAGIEAYYNMLDLESFRRNKIAEGELGPDATLKLAYVLQQLETGDFEETLNQVRAEERGKAVKATAESINQMNQTATHVNPADVGSGPSLDAMGVSQEDYSLLEQFGNLHPDEVHAFERRNPGITKRVEAIARRVQASAR